MNKTSYITTKITSRMQWLALARLARRDEHEVRLIKFLRCIQRANGGAKPHRDSGPVGDCKTRVRRVLEKDGSGADEAAGEALKRKRPAPEAGLQCLVAPRGVEPLSYG